MKNFAFVALSLLLSACYPNGVHQNEVVTLAEQPDNVVAVYDNSEVSVTETDDGKLVVTKRLEEDVAVYHDIADTEPGAEQEYDSAYDRFIDNVIIKQKSPNFIVYEYKDVRVDEIAPLASRYCEENGNRTALLRSIQLYKNHARLATFDCITLQ